MNTEVEKDGKGPAPLSPLYADVEPMLPLECKKLKSIFNLFFQLKFFSFKFTQLNINECIPNMKDLMEGQLTEIALVSALIVTMIYPMLPQVIKLKSVVCVCMHVCMYVCMNVCIN
jgi:hypothetical protein